MSDIELKPCQFCGAENYGGFENYCPNCGAKMDEN